MATFSTDADNKDEEDLLEVLDTGGPLRVLVSSYRKEIHQLRVHNVRGNRVQFKANHIKRDKIFAITEGNGRRCQLP